jgi:hypothetical protein
MGSSLMAGKENWKAQPDEHDYPAAHDFLSLVLPTVVVDDVVDRLQRATVVRFKAKDLLRASGLPALPVDNVHVAKDLKKVKSGSALSPVLLVRGESRRGLPLLIADGYHRICASHAIAEDADIPCRIVDLLDHS